MSTASQNAGVRKQRKQKYIVKLEKLLQENKGILVIYIDNVGSLQMQQIRISLRGKATILLGKNTLQRKVIREQAEKNPKLNSLLNSVVGNMGLVFTNADLLEVRKLIEANKQPAPASVKTPAQSDVIIPAGATGLDPGQTSFFQALNIATKIVKTQIEITNNVTLLKTGDKVSLSHIALLDKLGIKPFKYGAAVTTVYEDGSIYDAKALDITKDVVLEKFTSALSKFQAISVGISYPTEATVKYFVSAAFSKILAISLGTDYTFPESQKIKDILANPDAFKVAAPAATNAPAAAKAEVKKVEEVVEEEEDFGGFGLFD